MRIRIKNHQHLRVIASGSSEVLYNMPHLARFDIKFNFGTLRSERFSFVCSNTEYGKLCDRLGKRFEQFEIEQADDDTDAEGLLPDTRLSRDTTLLSRRFQGGHSNAGITITISRAEDEYGSWIFDVEDLENKIHRFSGSKYSPGRWKPPVLFKAFGAKYVFGQGREKRR